MSAPKTTETVASGGVAVAFDYSDYLERIATALEAIAASTLTNITISASLEEMTKAFSLQQRIFPGISTQPEVSRIGNWNDITTSITVNSASGLLVGQRVEGNNIAYGAKVLTIVGTTVTLDIETLGSGENVQLFFYAS